jgi:hypothetical protein
VCKTKPNLGEMGRMRECGLLIADCGFGAGVETPDRGKTKPLCRTQRACPADVIVGMIHRVKFCFFALVWGDELHI